MPASSSRRTRLAWFAALYMLSLAAFSTIVFALKWLVAR